MLQFDELAQSLKDLEPARKELADALGLDAIRREIEELDRKAAAPGFWDDMENSQKVLQRSSMLKDKLAAFERLESAFGDAYALIELGNEENDESLLPEAQEEIEKIKADLEQQRLTTLLNGEYDAKNAILTFHAGAGGTEAQDWAEMLYRMYCRWGERHGYKVKTLDYLDGEEAGLKSASILVEGVNAYGFLKSEMGVHRLVRVSPFDASGRRHTSFASLEVMPEIDDTVEVQINPEDIRMEAPIPGKAAVGIEVPNKENTAVMLRDLLESREFLNHPSKLAFAVGKDIAGETVVADIAKMPHLLIAGATGSGKSVCINTIIISLLYHSRPEEVKLIMIDPKVVELSVYNGIPHLYIPVVTDPKKAAGALNWAVAEMMERYQKFAEVNVRDLKGYNAKVDSLPPAPAPEDGKAASGGDGGRPEKMPQIVIIVDELADLMMVAPGEVEDAICRLAQLARAAGIHLIIATQRPSVNVITGLIKANMPSRIAFSVSSGVDSRTILDMNGAEKLLGKGDMLFYPQGYQKPSRIQGAFVSDEEVGKVVEFLAKQQSALQYSEEIEKKVSEVAAAVAGGAGGSSGLGAGPERDAYFIEAGKFIIEKDKASIGMLQRWFKIGFNRAARIMDQLAEAGVVGEEEGTKPRKVLMSMEEFEQYVDEHV